MKNFTTTSSSSMPAPWSPGPGLVWGMIVVSLGLHAIIFLVSETFMKSWRHEHLPIHSLVEALGTVIALIVAHKLLALSKHNVGPKHATRIAQALIVIGLLDGFHAANHVGNNFVWLHSVATFFGGCLFLLLVLPERYSGSLRQTWVVIAATLCLGTVSLLFPDIIPSMVADGRFTNTANTLNLVGGLFLIIAAVRLVTEYHLSKSVDDLLFCMHCLLFGLAALMFQSSVLWDAAWWGWHLLRLLAYLVALVFVILSEARLLHRFDRLSFELGQLAITDPLTTAYNRRYFDDQLVEEYTRARRYGKEFSVVMLDVDHFKRINDQFGHAEGDKVLRGLTACIQHYIRNIDVLARVGGEEFALILPATSENGALSLAERIRNTFQDTPTLTEDGKEIRATVSIGVVGLTPDVHSEKQLLERADRALYVAKQGGRNRTVVFTHQDAHAACPPVAAAVRVRPE